MLKKISEFLSHHLSHEELRKKAITLSHFCIIQISVIVFFLWQFFDLMTWYKSIVTPESFNEAAFWGAIISIGGALFGAVRYLNETFKTMNQKDKED